jgi:hypothetical protein
MSMTHIMPEPELQGAIHRCRVCRNVIPYDIFRIPIALSLSDHRTCTYPIPCFSAGKIFLLARVSQAALRRRAVESFSRLLQHKAQVKFLQINDKIAFA